jgi:hypothetical protein
MHWLVGDGHYGSLLLIMSVYDRPYNVTSRSYKGRMEGLYEVEDVSYIA